MYSPKIYPDQVKKLYLLKISYATLGQKVPITKIVRDALEKYIPEKADEIMKAGGVLSGSDEILGKKEV